MINILKIGNAIVIDFTDNDKYLHNGTIEVAPNELMVVIDGSDMATFKKMSNGDTLFGLLINLIQIQGEAVTKDNIIDKFGIIGFASGGGGAVDSVNGQTGEVVITAAGLGAISKTDADAAYASKEELASKADSSTVEALNTEIDNKQDTLVSGTNIKTINGETILGEGNLTISGGTQPRTWTFTTSSSLTTGDLVIITPSGFTASEWLSQVTNGDMVYLDKGQEYMKLSVSNIYHRTTGNSVVGLSFYSTRLYTISVVGISFRLNINRFPKGKTENGTSIGQNADVTDTDSYGVAIGYGVKSNGSNAIAIGNFIQEDELYSINIGNRFKVSNTRGLSYWDGTGMRKLKEQLDSKQNILTIDTEMSDTSENAVQNKVIKAYIDSLVGNILTQLLEVNGTN